MAGSSLREEEFSVTGSCLNSALRRDAAPILRKVRGDCGQGEGAELMLAEQRMKASTRISPPGSKVAAAVSARHPSRLKPCEIRRARSCPLCWWEVQNGTRS